MPYKVINRFLDKENGTLYEVGDEFPKGNTEPTKERIVELSKKHPKYQKAFIEELKDDGAALTKTELKKLNKSEQEQLIKDLNGDPSNAKNEEDRVTLILKLQKGD
ncbi:hypothetical protein LC040_06035 [Bacillus tianshenii]|nr:hypothetical protein LC040_06035 [Bacillus tianshenii]